MAPEIIVALIASFISLILGVLNNQSTKKISQKQNEIELKKSTIDALDKRILKLENIKVQISDRESNVVKWNSLEDRGRMAAFYSKNFKDVLKISHLIDKTLTDKLNASLKNMEKHIGNEKMRMKIDYNEVLKDLLEMSRLNDLILIELGKELDQLESKVTKIIYH
ncbi:hypothetical protein [Moheibacter lacus]|uniref:Uncharacterized protein n=1 Tax=Moheibacter lacus TaxID=2745851 RepID=A0A838ZRA8_9FLAO|nr:hypothetical protein [Moheibacter lacus]MBA5628932.1 hypothetical protein [Moheibacter lacus]